MEGKSLPTYAVFDDYRHVVRIAVLVRWFLLLTWFFLHNYRPTFDEIFYRNNGFALGLSAVNAYVSWRIWRGLPITRGHALVPSAMDLLVITVGIFTSTGFGNTAVVLYYPALLAMALVLPSRRLSFGAVTLTAITYAFLSVALEPGVSYAAMQEKVLVLRVSAMFGVVVAATLMHRVERTRRREAVEAERARAEENLELQRRAQEAELAAQRERDRIAREIHDGIAQSIYALNLSLETCAELAERDDGPLREQIQKLVPLARRTLLESRHYIHDLKPLVSGDSDLKALAESQVKEFEMVAGTPAQLSMRGEPREVPVAVATGIYRILQEALANVLKHADASNVDVLLTFEPGRVGLSVEDDGVGFETNGVRPGYGLDNMRQRAEELGGSFEISGSPGRGTRVSLVLPAQGGEE